MAKSPSLLTKGQPSNPEAGLNKPPVNPLVGPPLNPPSRPFILSPKNPWGLAFLLLIALITLAIGSLASGYLDFTFGEILDILISHLTEDDPVETNRSVIILEVRLPRVLTAAAVGAALALAGAIFQGLLLNPLADPYTLGVSSGAALGAAIVIFLGLTGPAWLGLPLAPSLGAFIGAAGSLMAVMALAREKDGSLTPTSLILAGVILGAILSAALSFLKYLAGDQVGSIVFWLLGSFQASSWTNFYLVALFLAPAFWVAIFSAVDLNVMTLGLNQAETLGVTVKATRARLLVAASLAAAAAVAVSGIIGFVGLIIPHLIRSLIGPDHRALIPVAALAGALSLVAADLVVRVVLPGEIPVGVLTALLAGPVFLVIFRRRLKDPSRG